MPTTPRQCPETMNVLLIGGGGREHALAWKMSQSPRLGKLFVEDSANTAIKALGEVCPEPITRPNLFTINRWCEREEINLIVIGPEAPLADGLADELTGENRVVFGVGGAAARLEADKAWAKDIMRSASIPTAESKTFQDPDSAKTFVAAKDEPCVIKASGLAAGKGVIVCETSEEAFDAIDLIMGVDDQGGAFGEAGTSIIVEQKLLGQELSVLALVDGRSIWVLDPCQDHKQVGEGDTGPNTGGMGAYCPTPLVNETLMARIERDILVPTIDALRREGITYRGVLYAGLMLTAGGPKVLEYNCRFGDPECQPLMARFDGDALEVFWAVATGTLEDISFNIDPRVACCVVMCSEGYPGPCEKGLPIGGLDGLGALAREGEELIAFHGGTTSEGGLTVTAGGRVMGLTALAADLTRARELANEGAAMVTFKGAFHRTDIGHRVLSTTAQK